MLSDRLRGREDADRDARSAPGNHGGRLGADHFDPALGLPLQKACEIDLQRLRQVPQRSHGRRAFAPLDLADH